MLNGTFVENKPDRSNVGDMIQSCWSAGRSLVISHKHCCLHQDASSDGYEFRLGEAPACRVKAHLAAARRRGIDLREKVMGKGM